MSKIVWDQVGQHFYETGVDHAVLYVYNKTQNAYGTGVAWNGITGITESPSGAEATPLYADNIKYLNLISTEEFGATVTAYTYPDEFMECDGSAELANGVMIGQQGRSMFGLVYRTVVGNDTLSNDYGDKLHIIYNCLAAPSEKAYSTINDSPEAIEFSWEVSTTPVEVKGKKPTASITIDRKKADPTKLATLEDYLFGTDATVDPAHEATDPQLAMPNKIAEIFGTAAAG